MSIETVFAVAIALLLALIADSYIGVSHLLG